MRALDALLATSSVSEAAAQLGLTQGAMSNALRRLREHYRDPLLVRRGSRMVRTPLAESLAPLAERAMAAAAEVLSPTSQFVPSEANGLLRVATSDHVDAVLLEPLAELLAEQAPGVRISVEPFTSASLERLRCSEISLVVAPWARMTDDLHVSTVLREGYVAVVRRGHPAASEPLTPERFAALSHLIVAPTGGARTVIDDALEHLSLSRVIDRIVPGFSQAILLTTETERICVLPASFAYRYAERLGLCTLDVPLALPEIHMGIGWIDRLHRDPLHTWFRRQLVALGAERSTR